MYLPTQLKKSNVNKQLWSTCHISLTFLQRWPLAWMWFYHSHKRLSTFIVLVFLKHLLTWQMTKQDCTVDLISISVITCVFVHISCFCFVFVFFGHSYFLLCELSVPFKTGLWFFLINLYFLYILRTSTFR